jgi:probable HAF family extracellular repeat protein
MKSTNSAEFIAVVLLGVLAVTVQVAAQEPPTQQQRTREHSRYKLVDIGTFGGPASYVNPAFSFGAPNQINRFGSTVGSSGTATPTLPVSNPGICGGGDGTLPFIFRAFKWEDGDVTDLGALPGDKNCSVAASINVNGEIAGRSEIDVVDPLFGWKEFRAVVWKDQEIRNLGTLGGNYSQADAINNRGQVVGGTTNAIPDPFSLLYQLVGSPDGTQTRAFLWEEGHIQDLGTLGGPDAEAFFVNEYGHVFGISYTNSTPNPVTGLPTTHPFIWTQENGMKDLGSLGGAKGWVDCECGGFNNRGQAVGLSNLAGDQIADPFLWDGEKLIDLFTGTVGGNPLTANALNDAGEVVGGGTFPNRPFDAFLWNDGQATDLGTVDGDGCSWARAINSRGQVVGQSFACDGSVVRSFLWENGSMVDLNTLIPRNSNLLLVDAVAINDRGEIAGIGLPPGCTLAIGDTQCGQAYVLIPCDHARSDDEECREANYEHATAAIQNSSAALNQNPVKAIEVGLTPREIAARMRARFSGGRGFGARPPK